jgi:hypothetical protein
MKKSTSFRLTNEAMRLIKEIAIKNGISQTAVLEIAVRNLSKKEGLQ